MHPTLKLALTTAEELLTELTADAEASKERTRLETLTKKQLIEELMVLKFKRSKPAKVQDLVYAVMCEPACAALNYATIASLVSKYAHSSTTGGNIGWYASKALEKGYDIVPRVSSEEFAKMMLFEA